MMSTKDVVVKLRPSRVNDITDQQIAYIPRFEEDQIECSIPYYVFEGRKIIPNPDTHIVFKLKYLHFNNKMNSIKRRNYRSCRENLKILVDKNVLRPFILFINGLFIPWVAISIIINNDDYYILINTLSARGLHNLCKNYEFVQIFSIPEKLIYIPDVRKVNSLPNKPLFMFGDDLRYTYAPKNARYALVPLVAKDQSNRLDYEYNYIHITGDASSVKLYDDSNKIKISEKNIFLFVDGLLHHGTFSSLKRAKLNGDTLSYYYDTKNEYKIIPTTVIGNILTVNRGIVLSGSYLDIIFIANSDFTSNNMDNVMRISERSRTSAIRSVNSGIYVPYFQRISAPFDLPIVKNLDYNSHISQSESRIAGYNPYLLNEVVKSYSTIDIKELSGYDILKASESNMLSLSLGNDGIYEERILLFINGFLYKNYSSFSIDKNTMHIPLDSTISKNDVVEIMRFSNVNNSEICMIINENDGFIHQYGCIINSDMVIFCKTPSNSAFEYPESGYQQFVVDYTLEQNEDGYIKIVLTDPFYYGKELTIVSNRRFIYKNFRIYRDGTDSVNLGNYFKFCTNKNRYMIFVNGRLLMPSQYSLTIPCDTESDNNQFILYLNSLLNDDDILDIVYSPTDFEEIMRLNQINSNGDIFIDNPASLDYVFSKELYMIWINGKKIPASQLDDISSSCIRINTDQHTTNNLRVIKYIQCDELKDTYHANSVWDEAIFNSGLSYDEINKIIGKENATLTNTEPDYTIKRGSLVIDMRNEKLYLHDTNGVITFSIEENIGVLSDISESIHTNIDGGTFYITAEGGNSQ